MHKMYKVAEQEAGIGKKEYFLPSKRRIDFLDKQNHIIYELKPNNPRAIKQGYKQLDIYLKEIMSMPKHNMHNWKTVLETY